MLVFLIRITRKNGPQAGDQHHQAHEEAHKPKAFGREEVQEGWQGWQSQSWIQSAWPLAPRPSRP